MNAFRNLPDFTLPTAAQTRNASAAEAMMTDALAGLRPEDIPALLASILTARFGAAAAERIGERTGTLAHIGGRK